VLLDTYACTSQLERYIWKVLVYDVTLKYIQTRRCSVSRDEYTSIFKGLEFVGFERVSFMRADNFTGVDTESVILCFTALHHPSLA
jgi:hypothetical protein